MTRATPPRVVGLVQYLELKRVTLRKGHQEWAAYLGIDRSVWYELRHGQTDLTLDLLQRVLREWPDEVEPFLRDAILGRRGRERGPGDRACAHLEVVRGAC